MSTVAQSCFVREGRAKSAWLTVVSWAHLSYLEKTGEQSCCVRFLWILVQPVTRALVVVLLAEGPSEVVGGHRRRTRPGVVSV